MLNLHPFAFRLHPFLDLPNFSCRLEHHTELAKPMLISADAVYTLSRPIKLTSRGRFVTARKANALLTRIMPGFVDRVVPGNL